MNMMNPTQTQILIVDDEEPIRRLLEGRLTREGFAVTQAGNGSEAITAWDGQPVVVTDLKMPGKDGFALMEALQRRAETLQTVAPRVILITGHGEKEVAVRALKQGAADYLEKPFDMDELVLAVRRAVAEHTLQTKNRELMGRLQARAKRAEAKNSGPTWIASQAAAMQSANEWLRILARESKPGVLDPSVLILGESGSGKEGVARQIHDESARNAGPWVAVNCANFSEQLLESELFGHEKGAFTGAQTMKRGLFELADGGTLFLDEIAEMDAKLQARILRVLQEHTFKRVGGLTDIFCDVRVIAATHQDLEARVRAGSFREDLLHRINRVVIRVAPLRERREDVLPLAESFARRALAERGKVFRGFAPDAQERLCYYDWPGNVRELLNAMERAALLYDGKTPITGHLLGLPGKPAELRPIGGAGAGTAPSIKAYAEAKRTTERQFEREYLEKLLTRSAGNVSAAAREAAVDRSNLLRLMRKHGLKSEVFRKGGGSSGAGSDRAA